MRVKTQSSPNEIFFLNYLPLKKGNGSPGTTVKLLPCDQEVMGSSPRKSLLQKCKEMMRT
jgi:hypothetical protein